MPTYKYQALQNNGATVKGVLEGDSEKQIRQMLRNQQLIPVKIQTISYSSQQTSGFRKLFSKKISTSDLALLTRQLATLMNASIPLTDALGSLAEQTEKKWIQGIVLSLKAKVQEGHTLAKALAEFPEVFSELFIASVMAGEQTGKLGNVLMRLADYIEKQQEMRQKIMQALIYPAVMVTVSLGIVSFLLTYVVPSIISVFQDSKQALPEVTLVLLALSHFLKSWGLFLLLGLVILFYFASYLLKKPKLRYKWQQFQLKLFGVGKLLKKVHTGRFLRTLGMLNGSGIPMVEAMTSASQTMSCLPLRNLMLQSTEKVRQGSAIAKSLKATECFSPMIVHLIASGESSGTLEALLDKAATIQETDIRRTIDTFLTLLEPLIIIIMGGIVMFIVLAILLPIFQLDQMTG